MGRPALWLAMALACGCGPAPEQGEPELALPPFTVLGRWERPRALRVRLDLEDGPLGAGRAGAVARRALAVWSRKGRVALLPVQAEADVVVTWAAEPFGHDTSVARTTPVGPGCTVLLDAGRAWTEADLFQAAVHELGHALGLGHTEDTGAVMHAQRETARTELGPADLAGLWSLYGGGVDGPGDLLVAGGPTLRRVAPPGRADWTLFDTDGDGDDELVVWALHAAGGALTAYHFAPGPLLERTVGPILGAAGHGAEVELRAEGGTRWLTSEWPDGARVRRRFDDRGVPGEPEQVPAEPPLVLARRSSGDLDGDGHFESLADRR